jgi:gluconolactonase
VISPDGKTIYIADNGASRRVLLAVELDGKGDAVSERLFHDFGKGRGIDGMTITVDGRVVATSAKDGNPGIVVFSPNGKIIGFIPTPETPANCEFGGSDRSTLYISAGTGLYRIETTMKGFALWPN